MKLKLYFFLVLTGIILNSHSQTLNIYEEDEHKVREITNETRVVDINCKLRLDFNKPTLLSKIPGYSSTNKQLVKKLENLTALLANQNEILAILRNPIAPTPEARARFGKLMIVFYEQILKDSMLEARANQLLEEANKKRPQIDRYEYLIENFLADQQSLSKELEAKTRNKKQISVEAFLYTKNEGKQRVHVENFDNYKEGEFFPIDRWVNKISQEEAEAFDKYFLKLDEYYRGLKENFDKINTDLLQPEQLMNNLGKARQRITEELANPKNAGIARPIKNNITEAETALKNIADLSKQPANANSVEVLSSAINKLSSKTAELTSDLQKLPEKLKTESALSNLLTILQNQLPNIKAIEEKLAPDLDKLQFLTDKSQLIVGNRHSFGIADLPEMAIVDLKTSGSRENFDQLTINVLLVPEEKEETPGQEPKTSKAPDQVIESVTLSLVKVKVYAEANFGLIMANPFNEHKEKKITSNFQFAPASNLLFKWGSRKSGFWNFMNPGIGISVSTPDFDLDGLPDLSFGSVGTLFRDVLSIGIAYNTKTNGPFWFFGLSIPFANLALPLNEVKTQLQ